VHGDASVVRYSVLREHEQLFASRYKLVLPTEEELRIELDQERAQFADGIQDHTAFAKRIKDDVF
jgi:hypothetical protein